MPIFQIFHREVKFIFRQLIISFADGKALHILKIPHKRNRVYWISVMDGDLLEKFHKPVSKLYQNQNVFIDSGIIFSSSSIILILVYEIFPIGRLYQKFD